MEEKDFSKSIKLTFIILFGASLFWFLFACQLVWAYDPGGSPLDLKKNSRMNDTILIQPGTGTSGGSDTARFRIYYGTQACVGVGNSGYILSGTPTGLPFIDYLYGNGSSTINFSGFTHVAVGGSDIPSASSIAGKIDAVAGTGTANVLTNTTLAGQGTITASFGANGLVISPAEYSCADGGTSPFQTQIDTKLTKVGTPTTYLNSVTADGKTGTSSFSLAGGSNIIFTSVLNPDGSLAITGDTSGSATAKSDIQEGGTVTASNVSHINFDNTDFDTSVDGLGASIALSAARKGTTTATAGYTVVGDSNGSITAWMPPVNVVFASKTDTQTLGSGWNNITGLAGTITLRSVNSRVKIDVSVVGWANDNSAIRIVRNGSVIGVGDAASNRSQVFVGTFLNSAYDNSSVVNSGFWVDTPGTTTAGYIIQGLVTSGSFHINRSNQDPDTSGGLRSVSTMLLTEIY